MITNTENNTLYFHFITGGNIMTGLPLILVFILAIILMIIMISKFKIHHADIARSRHCCRYSNR